MIFIIIFVTMLSIFWLQGKNIKKSQNKKKDIFNKFKLPIFSSLIILYIYNTVKIPLNNSILNQNIYTNLADF